MDANRIFNDILNHIEVSPLNYMINKTPFSATISLKSSFAKRFDNVSTHKNYASEENVKTRLNDNNSIQIAKLEAKVLDLEKAALEEQNNYKCDMKSLMNEKDKLEKLYEEGKTKLKISEDQVTSLREELIGVKKGEKMAGLSVKKIEEEHEQLKQETMKLKEDILNNSKVMKVQNSEVEKLTKDNESLEIKIEKLVIELSLQNKLETVEATTYSCSSCSHKSKTELELQSHVKINHYFDKWSQSYDSYFKKKKKVDVPVQTEEIKPAESQFSEYLCFYCERKIKSLEELELHRMVCHENQSALTNFPCDQCGAQCQDIGDLGRHRTTYHALGTLSTECDNELFWCDVCPLNFKSRIQLQFHVGEFHWNQF